MNTPDAPKPVSGADRVTVLILVVVGVWVMLGWEALGWDFIEERGGVRVLLGALILFYAVSLIERNRLKRRNVEIFEALNMLLYGRNYRRDREAIGILMKGLESKSPEVREKSWKNLKELTGQDFALDPAVWRAWWSASEKHFALKRRRPEEKE